MHKRDAIRARLDDVVPGIDDPPPDRRGKVREIYEHGANLLLVVTDRVSAFDVVLGTIPLKGALLVAQTAFWLERAKAVMPTHLLDVPAPQVLRCQKATPLPIELVVRGYLAGSLAREPAATRGHVWGLTLDPAQAPYTKFPQPILTPTTKADVGTHDEPIALDEAVRRGLVTARNAAEAAEKALALFALGQAVAAERGLILVDTKYEMGLVEGTLTLIDEIHTSDSSRYWDASTYETRLRNGDPPDMLDKERLRRWLVDQGFQGHGAPPALPDSVREDLALHYWELAERLLGTTLAAPPLGAAAALPQTLRTLLG